VSELEINVPFQHKHGYIGDERGGGVLSTDCRLILFIFKQIITSVPQNRSVTEYICTIQIYT